MEVVRGQRPRAARLLETSSRFHDALHTGNTERSNSRRRDPPSRRDAVPYENEDYRAKSKTHGLSDRWDRVDDTPYDCPTRRGRFVNAMSALERNPCDESTRKVSGRSDFESKFNEQLSHALALKLNLSTHQHANERAIGAMRRNGANRCSLKQTVQERAAIYDSQVKTRWFEKSEDVSRKAKTPKLRRTVRSNLIGAPLFVLQLGLDDVQETLQTGDARVLDLIKWSEKGMMGTLIT